MNRREIKNKYHRYEQKIDMLDDLMGYHGFDVSKELSHIRNRFNWPANGGPGIAVMLMYYLFLNDNCETKQTEKHGNNYTIVFGESCSVYILAPGSITLTPRVEND